MYPASFEYLAPSSVEEAVELLARHGGDAKVLAGGMSLIPVMKLRLASPRYVVDIGRIRELDYLREEGGRLLIGALTRHHALESSPLVRDKAWLLSETASSIGDPQVRNRGTLGGSLAHSDPSGDWGAAMLAMRAGVRVAGPGGSERSIAIDDFLVDTFTSALKQGELLVEVSVPIPPSGSGGAYVKLERKVGDFATAAAAAQLSLDEKGACTYIGVGLTALGPRNLRARGVEGALLGKKVTADSIATASALAAKECDPSGDPLRGSAEYKREMAELCTRRALAAAASRAMKGVSNG